MADPLSFDDLIPAQPQAGAPGAPQQQTAAPVAWGEQPIRPDQAQAQGLPVYDGTPAQMQDFEQGTGAQQFGPMTRAYARRDPQTGQMFLRAPLPPQSAPGGQQSPSMAPPAPQQQQVAPAASSPPVAPQSISFGDLVPNAPPPSTLNDVMSSFPSGLSQGAAKMLAIPGDIRDAWEKVAQWSVNQGAKAGGRTADPNFIHNMSSGPLADPTTQLLNLAPNLQQTDAMAQRIGGQFYQPQTTAGRYAETLGEFAPNALFGPEGLGAGALTARIAGTVVPSVASRGASDAAVAMGHPEFAPAAGVAGALLGGGAVHAGSSLLNPGKAAFAEQGAALTPQHVAAMQSLRQNGQAMGVPLSFGEAAAQVAPGLTNYPTTQQIVEGTTAGRKAFAPVIAARPAAMQASLNPVLDNIAPPGVQPGMLGRQAKQVAQGALDNTRQAVNAPANPLYANAQRDLVDPADYSTLAANPSYQVALNAVRGHPELGASIAHLPDNNAGVINEVVKELDRSANAQHITELNPNGNNWLADLRDKASSIANRVAGASSTNYAGARQTVAQGMRQSYEPLQSGPVGTIASTDNLGTQTRALYPSRPFEGAPAETADAVTGMNAAQPTLPQAQPTNPMVAALLTRQHLAKASNEAMQATARGPNLYGGAQFAAGVSGNPLQAQTLQAGVTAAAGPEAAQKLADALDVYSATGRRLPVTPTDQVTAGLVNPGRGTDPFEATTALNVGHEAGGALGTIGVLGAKGLSMAGNALTRLRATAAARSLADMLLTGPDDTAGVLQRARQFQADQNHLLAQTIMNGVTAAQPQK